MNVLAAPTALFKSLGIASILRWRSTEIAFNCSCFFCFSINCFACSKYFEHALFNQIFNELDELDDPFTKDDYDSPSP